MVGALITFAICLVVYLSVVYFVSRHIRRKNNQRLETEVTDEAFAELIKDFWNSKSERD